MPSELLADFSSSHPLQGPLLRDPLLQVGACWRIALDTGGTFTDAIAIAPDGTWHRRKVPSDGAIPARAVSIDSMTIRLEVPSWLPASTRFLDGWILATRAGETARLVASSNGVWTVDRPITIDGAVRLTGGLDAPMLAVHVLTGCMPDEPLPPLELRLSTTRGTNALLQRRGARTALIVSRGFADILDIGDQSRPQLFALAIEKPAPIAHMVVAIDERRCADGTVRAAPDPAALDLLAAHLKQHGIESVAIALLHALPDPAHEHLVRAAMQRGGFNDVALASELCDAPRYLSRAETSVVHATLAPVIRRYLADVATRVSSRSTFMLTSAGGLQRADRFLARDCLLSGPAGGLAGVAEAGRRVGRTRLLGLDMGGTSADVSRFDGDFTYRFETRVGSARVAAPALAIESVAAGGGSICSFVRGELRVGPESAGAHPGPACYGQGGPFTLTDVNLLLGRMDPARAIVPITAAPSEQACEALRAMVSASRGTSMTRNELLLSLVAIADERMAMAIAAVSVREGADPRDYTLVPFGGAGGQHACSLAERLGISEILFPVDAGLLSARGLLGASIERFAAEPVFAPLSAIETSLDARMRAVETQALDAVRSESGDGPVAIAQRLVSIRLVGQDQALEIPFGDASAIRRSFRDAFEQRFGYPPPGRELEVEALRAIARAEVPVLRENARGTATVAPGGGALPVFDRHSLPPGSSISGPALVVDDGATVSLAKEWTADVTDDSDLLARRLSPALHRDEAAAELDLFACRLEAIATSMGELLRRTAFSTNVKERLDFSCAVLDAQGTLLQNAPHLPVHLGAIGACVRGVAQTIDLHPGDVAITNHPAFGGSHLPDVTLVTPVFVQATLIGYVANRAHHAEIGGTRPGSFPPAATRLVEEGVVISPTLLVRGDGGPRAMEDGLAQLARMFTEAPYPTRALDENLADIRAALAANASGAAQLRRLAERHGVERMQALGEALLARADHALGIALARLPAGRRDVFERLDDGSPIALTVTLRAGGTACVDFTGTAATHPGNLNAPLAVVRAATLYVLRLLIGEDIPMNEGLLRRIELIVPEGSLLNPIFDPDPARCPAVVAGNTETSQRVTDALLRAFHLAACSQGTMNNLLFGNEHYSAYETIAGGSGATHERAGADAVHTHMTNTRITDPEVLERRCPVLIREFAIRRESGGRGAQRGGDGVTREIEFLTPVQVSFLSQHRVERPYGAEGGDHGAPGQQWLVRRDGTREPLPGIVALDCRAGEAIRIETPGGGAWGPA